MPQRHYRITPKHRQIEASPLPDGLLYGEGVYTTFILNPSQSVVNLKAHFNRLATDSCFFHLECPWNTEDELEQTLHSLLPLLDDSPQVVRLTLIPSESFLTGHTDPRPLTVYASIRPIPALLHPVRLKTVTFDRLFPHHKHCSQGADGYFLQQVKRQGVDDFIRVSTQGVLTESAYANLFLVWPDDSIRTPNLESGCLPGTMRDAIIKACTRLSIPVIETRCSPDDLDQARGVFLTNAVRGLYPVAQIDGMSYHPNAIEPILEAIRTDLRSRNRL